MSQSKTKLGLKQIVRAVFIGVLLYALMRMLPFLILKFSGVQIENDEAPITMVDVNDTNDEPVYHDRSGKRIGESEFQVLSGYELAMEKKILSHAQCKTMEKIYIRNGCSKYVTEQKHIPPHIKQMHVDPNKSTAQCQAEVNAFYIPLIQDTRELGDAIAADSWANRDWSPELQECENNDHVRIVTIIYEPRYRVDALIKKLEHGGVVSAEDRATVLKDLTAAAQFRDGPEKLAYIEKSNYFFQLADAKKRPSP